MTRSPRDSHRIQPVTVLRDLFYVEVCSHDGIRVHRNRDGRYRHDLTELREANEASIVDKSLR